MKNNKKNLQFDLRARVIHVHVRFFVVVFFDSTSSLFAPFTLSCDTRCARVFVYAANVFVYGNCYSTPLTQKLLEVMDTLYIRFFKYTFQFVLVLLCCCCCCFLFAHKCQTLWLICSHYAFFFVCVWWANNVLSISILIFFFLNFHSFASFYCCNLSQFQYTATNATTTAANVVTFSLSRSPISTFTFFLYIIIFHQCRCHFAILQMNFFSSLFLRCHSFIDVTWNACRIQLKHR